ncbi:hypothetical protein [Streptomyces abikoensis]|uniref:hypothetical protein n=1 Tax=Streptomyces abikoensis TaxID=97398 RepID=UPI0036AC9E74
MYATELAVKALEPTPEEERLAEDYVTILGSLSAMEQAVREGAWHRLREEADELMSAAEEMWAGLPGADEEGVPVRAAHVPSQADSSKIRQLIAVYAQPYALGRVLYPTSLIQDAQLRRAVEEENTEREHAAEHTAVE